MTTEAVDQFLTQNLGEPGTTIARDLSLNFKKMVAESSLSQEESALAVLSVAETLHLKSMSLWAAGQLETLGLSGDQIREAKESAAIMGMLNTYYKFKSYLPSEVLEHYSRAGLRMQSLMKPHNGKEKFEMMAFAVSVVNGCPSCIASHEQALSQLGVDREKIHDLARLAAVCKGISHLLPSHV